MTNTILEAVSEMETALDKLQSNFKDKVEFDFDLPGHNPAFTCPVGLLDIADALDVPVVVECGLGNGHYTASVTYRGITFCTHFWMKDGPVKGIWDEDLLSFLNMPGVIPAEATQ